MLLWEEGALKDREKIFEFLYAFNPLAAEKADVIIEQKAESLLDQPLKEVNRENSKDRLFIIPDISMILVYHVRASDILILRVLHQKQRFPS